MTDPAYRDYWRRKELLASVPAFPVRRWWASESLCDIERVYFDAIRAAPDVLDVGAGDLRVMKRMQAAGYSGTWHNQDVGTEFRYEYASLDDVKRQYGAVLCLDVIEHLTLGDGLRLLDRLIQIVVPGGVLIIQTPNARCIRHPLGWDMTHLHVYNAPDLWAWFTARGLECHGYRVRFGEPESGFAKLRAQASAWVISRLLGSDYADNILLLAKLPAIAQ